MPHLITFTFFLLFLQLLQQLTQTPLNFSTSEAQEHARKNRYDYNLPCELWSQLLIFCVFRVFELI